MMNTSQPPLLDMTPEGEFRAPAFRLSWPMRVGLVALGVSFVAGVVATVMIVIFLALSAVPLMLGAAAIAYAAFRLQARRGGGALVRRP